MTDREQPERQSTHPDGRLVDWTIYTYGPAPAFDPVVDATVTIYRAIGTTHKRLRSGPDGRCHLKARPGAQMRITVEAEGYLPVSVETSVEPNGMATIPLQAVPPPQPVHQMLVGQLRLSGSSFIDDTGFVLPRFVHKGDLFALWTRDRPQAIGEVLSCVGVGWQGARVWTALGSPYWESKDRDVSPTHPTRGDTYWQEWAEFAAFCASVNFRLLVSQGDFNAMGDPSVAGARLASSVAPHPWVYALLDGANEWYATGVRDILSLQTLTQAYRDAGGTALLTLSSPESMAFEDLLLMCQRPADLYEIEHGNPRQGHWYDKVRRAFNSGYESGAQLPLPVGIQSEGVGPDWSGSVISVAENLHEMDTEAVGLVTVASFVGGVLWVWFSGEGVWHRRGLAAEAGFADTPALIESLPPDLMRWETICHAGPRWAGTRVFACDEEGVRIEQRICSDGRFLAVAHGPSGIHHLRVERACELAVDSEPVERMDSGTIYSYPWTRGLVIRGRLA